MLPGAVGARPRPGGRCHGPWGCDQDGGARPGAVGVRPRSWRRGQGPWWRGQDRGGAASGRGGTAKAVGVRPAVVRHGTGMAKTVGARQGLCGHGQGPW